MEYFLLAIVAEGDILEFHVAPQLGIRHRIVRRMGMLPCPVAGLLFAFGDGAVRRKIGVHQLHIPFVLFRLGVNDLKDPLRTG